MKNRSNQTILSELLKNTWWTFVLGGSVDLCGLIGIVDQIISLLLITHLI